MEHFPKIYGTTILGVMRDNEVALGGDGQVTFGETVMKHNTVKVRKMFNDTVLAGFAGATADAFTLFDKFEEKLEQYSGNLNRAAVELAKEWRTDKYLRRLEALLAVMDSKRAFVLSGSGDVIEPENGVIAIGSGGAYAQAAALALKKHTKMTARKIVEEALITTAGICIYTNDKIVIEELTNKQRKSAGK
ncbi:ATP-dependent protease subunit HslV [candidate division KSB1 bacterium]